jgi:hypothetical protein
MRLAHPQLQQTIVKKELTPSKIYRHSKQKEVDLFLRLECRLTNRKKSLLRR